MPGSRTTLPHTALTLLLTAPLSCHPGEEDGQVSDPQGCRTVILPPEPYCGDGNMDPDEECDLGAGNGDAARCTAECRLGICGDGLVIADSEECDLGPTNRDDALCTAECRHAVCGDGLLLPDVEACDNGPNNADNAPCTPECQHAVCGDGLVLSDAEGCDDGNDVQTDACLSDCTLPTCGDGLVWQGVEECDDGRENADDADCTSTCTQAACGDGLVHAGVEECDDGNDDDGDACTSSCQLAKCGDGLLNMDVEECDDGEMNADDADCTSSCLLAKCGDGLLNMDIEECDDGNTLPGDGCDPACARETVLVFVSSTKFKGNLLPALDNKQGLALADAHCQVLASAAGLQGSFMAWLADASQGPKDRFSLPTPYSGLFKLPNSSLLASGWQDLTDGSLDHPLDVDEYGASVDSSTVWSNTKPDGSSAGPDHCMDWSSSNIGVYGRVGVTKSADTLWTDLDITACANSAHLYCFQVTP